MIIICVDDEALLAENTAATCRRLPQVEEAVAMTRGKKALEWFEQNYADIAILDIDMPDMSGLQLAAHIRMISPGTKIIFLTGFSQYAVEAFRLRASGYLMKPVDEEDLAKEIDYALHGDHKEHTGEEHVDIRTFGGFDVFVDGEMVRFRQKKCKELFAILVDRRGASISRTEAFAMIYEDRLYDRPMQKQLDSIIRYMRESLRAYGIEDVFELSSGQLRICPEKVSCDLYRFLDGDPEAVNSFKGEYMSAYPWAEAMEGILSGKI
ncbi:MAG: response regulator [Mogibacterium sp.]|nr:response regulator [Mogibacterium sp.]